MEKRDKAEELMSALHNIEPLEDVPTDVSLRFHETLKGLASRDLQVKPKKNWLTGGNQFAIAASFTLVFALGAVVILNLGNDSGDSIGVSQNKTDVTQAEDDVKDDQLLYSAGERSIPQKSNTPVKFSNSGHDYAAIPSEFQKSVGVATTWNSVEAINSTLRKCLITLGLEDSVNLIDTGILNRKVVNAIWSPVTANSWNVYLLDADCNVLDKKFVSE